MQNAVDKRTSWGSGCQGSGFSGEISKLEVRIKLEFRMKNVETGRGSPPLFRHSNIRRSDLIRGFELRNSDFRFPQPRTLNPDTLNPILYFQCHVTLALALRGRARAARSAIRSARGRNHFLHPSRTSRLYSLRPAASLLYTNDARIGCAAASAGWIRARFGKRWSAPLRTS